MTRPSDLALATGLVMLLAAASLAFGCAKPAAGPPTPPTPAVTEAPSSTPPATPGVTPTPTAAPAPKGKVVVSVYFSKEATGTRDGQVVTGERLVRVSRVVRVSTGGFPPQPELLRATLDAWLMGPTAAEAAEGLWVAAPRGLKVRSADIGSGRIAVIDLPKTFNPAGGSAATLNRLGQLVFVATENQQSVKAVVLELDGKRVTTFGEGLEITHPLTRADVQSYFVK